MNITRPIPSTIEGIQFGILSSEEILRLSVKLISNPQAIDPLLLHPNPGGLYDPALGAILDHPCSTCNLDLRSCPGHPGHIELPFNVYHCQYIDQAFKLLRAQCFNCRRLRLNSVDSTRFVCQLRLIRHGLLKQARFLEEVGKDDASKLEGPQDDQASDEASENEAEKHRIAVKCEKYTRREIRKAFQQGEVSPILTEAAATARREVVQEAMSSMGKTRKCPFCRAYTPNYRKNRAIGIFQKPLNKKESARNAQNPELKLKKIRDPMQDVTETRRRTAKKAAEEAKRRERELRGQELHSDEGVADMGSTSQEDDEVHVLDSPVEDVESSGEELVEDTVRNAAEDGLSARSMIQSEPTMAKAKKKRKEDDEEQQIPLSPDEVRARLQQLFQRDSELFAEIYIPPAIGHEHQTPSADMFFIRRLLVPPNKYRKESKTGPDEISEAADNAPYRQILTVSQDIYSLRREIKAGNKVYNDLLIAWNNLQGRVNALIDITKAIGRPSQTDKGIKQKLEKKEGIMRMNIMGKRVNFAARSVISPDPNLEANEVGVPPVFAKRLTYPEPVTTHNFAELKQAVINGPDKWPGAVAVEYETGQIINLRKKTIVDRQALANSLLAPSTALLSGARPKRVLRHLNNGDHVIMNRQPTLHKPSMMAHRAKVLPGEKTIRMHYANTNSYNADFDGDEMNMHFPQNEIARAEAMDIANTDHQYLSTTSGSPLRGLIQDHISMGVWLSCQDSFYNKEEYHELLYSCMRPENNQVNTDRIDTIDPSVWKPRALWTGKDVISTILINIQPKDHAPLSMEAKCQVSADRWGPSSAEGVLRIQENYLLTGCLDKTQIGAKSDGLVHSVYEAYGCEVAGKLISILGRLLTRMLNMRAFSCGIEDLIVTDDGEQTRKDAIKSSEVAGLPAAAQYVTLDDERNMDDPELIERLETVTRDEEKLVGLDGVMRKALNLFDKDIVKATVPGGLVKLFPYNQMQTMTTSGAKGSHNNATRISANLGQQNLEGRRVPIMISGRTLPTFKAFEPTLRAGGFITDRFLTGVRPQEYFFHSMSGREGLVDTAVKTSRSGYLQRCVIKGLEGCTAGHDGSVRDADGTMIQTLYGEDGLEVSQQAKINDFSFIASNMRSYLSRLDVVENEAMFKDRDRVRREYNRKAEKTFRKTGDLTSIDPALAVYAPTTYVGSTSEKFYTAVKDYIDRNEEEKVTDKKKGIDGVISKRVLETISDHNYLRALVPAGDAIGVVAGQSIGEPSTQMTLNTFHMAGSAQNVTLGIPRLREILMAATKNIKTPSMTLHFLPEITDDDRQIFVNSITKRSLAELVDSLEVSEQAGKSDFMGEARIYDITLSLYPKDEYVPTYSITPEDVAFTLEDKFVYHLDMAAKREIKRRNQSRSSAKVSDANPTIGKSSGRVREQAAEPEADHEGGDSDAEGGGDDDATNAKRRQNVDEGRTYDEPDESDEEIERAGEREASPGVEHEDEGYGGSPAASRETSPNATSQPTTSRKRKRQPQTSAVGRAREQKVKDHFAHVTSFAFNEVDDGPADTCTLTLEYPSNTPKLLLLPMVKQALRQSLIQEFRSLESATLAKPTEPGQPFFNEGSYVTTNGVNLVDFRKENLPEIIDMNRIYANSIHHMLESYGVECARECIIAELHSVFSGHGISVDRRHLTLVADFMTRDGGYLPFNRIGMKDDASVFKKMSFETTVGFLRDTVIEGGREELRNPSARLTVGAVGKAGTGAFDVLLPLEEPDPEVKKEEKEEGDDDDMEVTQEL